MTDTSQTFTVMSQRVGQNGLICPSCTLCSHERKSSYQYDHQITPTNGENIWNLCVRPNFFYSSGGGYFIFIQKSLVTPLMMTIEVYF